MQGGVRVTVTSMARLATLRGVRPRAAAVAAAVAVVDAVRAGVVAVVVGAVHTDVAAAVRPKRQLHLELERRDDEVGAADLGFGRIVVSEIS
jgi:hypothetical protein